jgi:hypothetical protein
VLHSELGFPSQFKSIKDKALAAKLRLIVKEKIIPGARWVEIQRSLVHFGRYYDWLPWYRHSFYRELDDALEEAKKLHIDPAAVYSNLLILYKDRAQPKAAADGDLEGAIYKLILQAKYAISHRHRLSKRLLRWNIDRPIGVVCERAFTLVHSLRSLVPPMVTAAVIRTLRNGWVTGRRMRFLHSSELINQCRLGCPPECCDSIEHYARCPTVYWLRCTFLRLPADLGSLNSFLWLGGVSFDLTPSNIALWALSLQVIYKAVNDFRNSTSPPLPSDIRPYLKQSCFNSARGFPKLEKFLSMATKWIPPAVPHS